MKVEELIEKLVCYPKGLEVRIMNTVIDSDESCPSFELTSVESFSEIAREAETDGLNPDTDCVLLEFSDSLYIKEIYDIKFNPNAIPMLPVKSSQINSVGWQSDTLFIEFTKGTIYSYKNVPESFFEALKKAESVGKYFASEIKGKFELWKD